MFGLPTTDGGCRGHHCCRRVGEIIIKIEIDRNKLIPTLTAYCLLSFEQERWNSRLADYLPRNWYQAGFHPVRCTLLQKNPLWYNSFTAYVVRAGTMKLPPTEDICRNWYQIHNHPNMVSFRPLQWHIAPDPAQTRHRRGVGGGMLKRFNEIH
jgi:hypothetical protein